MTVHFNKVWRLRTGVNFAPLGKNWFRVTLFSEGDYDFVARGGPWIYRGYPLLVCKIQGEARPSETILNGLIGSMPLQFPQVEEMPLQKLKLDICHCNYLIPLHMPFCSIPSHTLPLYT
jgi:hypothetical protein